MTITSEQFKAKCTGLWLPMEVLTDSRLTLEDTALLVIIDALDDDKKHCSASNEYLGGCLGCSENKISLSISKLIKLGYLERVAFDGRIRILTSNMKKIIAELAEEKKKLNSQSNSAFAAEKV